MKKWFDEIFGKILAVGENRYVHSTIGALIASIVMCLFPIFTKMWISVLVCAVITAAIAIVKEYLFDSKSDWIDVIYTIIGSLFICLPMIIYYICAK